MLSNIRPDVHILTLCLHHPIRCVTAATEGGAPLTRYRGWSRGLGYVVMLSVGGVSHCMEQHTVLVLYLGFNEGIRDCVADTKINVNIMPYYTDALIRQ